jgi:hypothetical protein
VCIGLVVKREGFPAGYEMFAGNRHDITTVEEIIESMEKKYVKTNRIWVMDRGMANESNFEFLKEKGSRYIQGANRGQLRKYEDDLIKTDWEQVRAGLTVKRVESPAGQEIFILSRSEARAQKKRPCMKDLREGLKRDLCRWPQDVKRDDTR